MIRTNVLEVVKTDDDIPRMIASGLLKPVDEAADITKLANIVLRHHCDERCKIRIGTGNTEKDFKCRKNHAVKNSPDPTKHNFVPIEYKFEQATLDILQDIGMYTPPINEEDKIGKFEDLYFNPTRHVPPYNFNATCDRSPVISDFLLLQPSLCKMHNV